MGLKWTAAAGVLAWAMLTAGAAQADSACSGVSPADYRKDVAATFAWKGAQVVDGATLKGPADLQRYAGKPIIVRNAKFAGADFTALHLADVCFEETDLSGSNWRAGQGERLAFAFTDLSGATLATADLRGAQFFHAKLDGANAAFANLTGATMAASSVSGLDLSNADLTDFVLTCSLINGEDCEWPDKPVDARQANMTRTRLDWYLLDNWLLEGARLKGATVQLRQIARFRDAEVVGPVVIEASGYGGARVKISGAEWRALLAAWKTDAHGPSFDCELARTPVERRICAPPTYGHVSWLAELDADLGRIYREALAARRVTPDDQRTWLATRSGCMSTKDAETCLSDAYRARIEALTLRLGPPDWLQPGVQAVYVDTDLPVRAEFKQTALYRKLLPVIVDSSMSTVIVTATDTGRLRASGFAWGSNGHECTLGDEGSLAAFTLNPETGWFGGPHKPYDTDQRRWEDVLRLWGEHAEVASEERGRQFSDYFGCGARASFGPMTRVPGSWADYRPAQP
ncbi:pentapeptide repeat-containing protein [Caulobacter sp. 17J65-9]|uniref:pentapeptide repeat-containing protein n=1 Tax=Caulobacter sp. 17J65-9 TaxID=2709382 RepID=UPI0013C931AF|nr:pentapeptide repeat-containing protein [Caulobacter sp. 17J65-9]NEX93549.1 hypothetical protein [Caulobacter sp. 17J65-9]